MTRKKRRMMRMGTPPRMEGTLLSLAAKTRARMEMRCVDSMVEGGIMGRKGGYPVTVGSLFSRMRMTMTTTMTTTMMTTMKTMSLRAAAPALPLQGTPQTLTPTKAHPPPWAGSQGEPLQSSLPN